MIKPWLFEKSKEWSKPSCVQLGFNLYCIEEDSVLEFFQQLSKIRICYAVALSSKVSDLLSQSISYRRPNGKTPMGYA